MLHGGHGDNEFAVSAPKFLLPVSAGPVVKVLEEDVIRILVCWVVRVLADSVLQERLCVAIV